MTCAQDDEDTLALSRLTHRVRTLVRVWADFGADTTMGIWQAVNELNNDVSSRWLDKFTDLATRRTEELLALDA
jgi:hypothetical protein